jgi:hypothetical protein
MASKKIPIKFELVREAKAAPSKALSVQPCRTKCGKKGAYEGWCAACYSKYKKGVYTSDGSLSPAAIKRQKEVDDKKRKKEVRREVVKLETVKEDLAKSLTPSILKVLSSENPDMDKPKYCERLAFWTSDSICYSRLFISQNKKCSKCKLHNKSLDSLLQLVEKNNDKNIEITTTQEERQTDGGSGAGHSTPGATAL